LDIKKERTSIIFFLLFIKMFENLQCDKWVDRKSRYLRNNDHFILHEINDSTLSNQYLHLIRHHQRLQQQRRQKM
jgi:hypothetical protein